MAIYTTLFLSRPEQLQAGFPGSRLPLPEAVRREFRNPFTGELTVIETREPEWPEPKVSDPIQVQRQTVTIEGRYADYLEDRLPPFLRGCEHWAAKGLTDGELSPLLVAVGAAGSLTFPIYLPPSSSAAVQQFPTDFVARLATIDPKVVARLWAAEMSTPQHTHSVSGRRMLNSWTTEQAAQVLGSILLLAGKATADQLMYLLVEA